MRLLVLLAMLVYPIQGFSASDEDHGIGRIVTQELDLFYIDHVLTGKIGDRPVFAKPIKGGGLFLWHKAEGQEFETALNNQDGSLKASVGSLTTKARNYNKNFTIKNISKDAGTIRGTHGKREFTVTVTSDTMEGHHYVNPHFQIEFEDGGNYDFTLEGSSACMGCATKLSFAIISMLDAYYIDWNR